MTANDVGIGRISDVEFVQNSNAKNTHNWNENPDGWKYLQSKIQTVVVGIVDFLCGSYVYLNVIIILFYTGLYCTTRNTTIRGVFTSLVIVIIFYIFFINKSYLNLYYLELFFKNTYRTVETQLQPIES